MYEAEETFISADGDVLYHRGGLICGPCPPPQTSYRPPHTFHPPTFLLNVIDFENETDQTAHIRKRLHDLPSVRNTHDHRLHAYRP